MLHIIQLEGATPTKEEIDILTYTGNYDKQIKDTISTGSLTGLLYYHHPLDLSHRHICGYRDSSK